MKIDAIAATGKKKNMMNVFNASKTPPSEKEEYVSVGNTKKRSMNIVGIAQKFNLLT